MISERELKPQGKYLHGALFRGGPAFWPYILVILGIRINYIKEIGNHKERGRINTSDCPLLSFSDEVGKNSESGQLTVLPCK